MQSVPAVSHSTHNYPFTLHATLRMQQRGIPGHLVEEVLTYGRIIHSRGVTFRVVGKKEVARFAQKGIDLSHAEGIHVLMESDGSVITTYRNHDLRKIRPYKRKHSMHH